MMHYFRVKTWAPLQHHNMTFALHRKFYFLFCTRDLNRTVIHLKISPLDSNLYSLFISLLLLEIYFLATRIFNTCTTHPQNAEHSLLFRLSQQHNTNDACHFDVIAHRWFSFSFITIANILRHSKIICKCLGRHYKENHNL